MLSRRELLKLTVLGLAVPLTSIPNSESLKEKGRPWKIRVWDNDLLIVEEEFNSIGSIDRVVVGMNCTCSYLKVNKASLVSPDSREVFKQLNEIHMHNGDTLEVTWHFDFV